MSDDPVERAARACEQSDQELCEIVGFDELPRERRAAIICRRHARAAIASLRVPTAEMIEAWQAECAGDADEAGPEKIRKAWASCIDAALSEPRIEAAAGSAPRLREDAAAREPGEGGE